ncbi:protein transport protein Sec24A [Copidosoma floridanum]|uniref:protein transport protein Sec24A n=1 Tax=Copidosoma floridanum TaxID=29053 RepID=UPI0006C93F54|nr:protein transport protein Sec24A [Copidosoma floridanum]XP_014217601.1 protein transport protein Sec24A [Copidosoma floridanum]
MIRQTADPATTSASLSNINHVASIHLEQQQQKQAACTGQSLPRNGHLYSTLVPNNNTGSVPRSRLTHERLQLSNRGLLPMSSQIDEELVSDSSRSVFKSSPHMVSGDLQFNSSGQVTSSANTSTSINSSLIGHRPLMSNETQANSLLSSSVSSSSNAHHQQQLMPNSSNIDPCGYLLINDFPLTSNSQQIIARTSNAGPSLFSGQQSNISSFNNESRFDNVPLISNALLQADRLVNRRSQMPSTSQHINHPTLVTQLVNNSGLVSNIKSPVSSVSSPQQINALKYTSCDGLTATTGSVSTMLLNMKSPVSSASLSNSETIQISKHHLFSPRSPAGSIGLGHEADSSSRQPMNSSGPPVNIRPLNSRHAIKNGSPLSTSKFLGTQSLSSGGSLGAFLPQAPLISSKALMSGNAASMPNSISSIPRGDSTHGLLDQFQYISITEASSQHSQKLEPLPNSMAQINSSPQTYNTTTNQSLDTKPANYLASRPYASQINHQQTTSVTKQGFNKIWGMDSTDIILCRNILPAKKIEPPRIKLHQDLLDRVNCSPDIFRCTLTKIPESNSLLQKARLPLGILIHPFKDLNHLPVIQCNTIVRCRSCRTYINPFVYFIDSKRWKCNLCYKVNELPDEFQFDPATKSYGDPSRRPEIRTSTIEFIAPSEYMLRPPQPAVYIMVFDVSRLAIESGYLALVCNIITEELSRIPGDSRTQIGILAVDSAVHFFGMPDNVSQPQHMIMMDVEDVFLPSPDNLVVNLKEREELLKCLLIQLPQIFKDSHETSCALGAALQVAYKLTSPTGGRVSVFQTCLPNIGPGSLQPRENPNARAGKDVPWLNPATDFYKRLALDCSIQQVAVDLFLLNCQYSDLASLSGICKFSGGCVYNVPLFQASRLPQAELLDRMLRRYLTRKIGFEAVMRVRCTRGIGVHTFHGNFFVRSTDLLSLPNINPDAGFGMQLTIDESLTDATNVCFQAALLYTSSRGERRIRVHTLCLPTTANLSEVLHSADQQCIVGLLAKMAVDRSVSSSLSDAREALINAVVDYLSAYKLIQSYPGEGLLAPDNLKLLPMYIIALLKSRAFRFGISTRVDDRFYAMCQLKTLPLGQLVQFVYPDLYAIHDFVFDRRITQTEDGQLYSAPDKLHLSAEKLDSRGAFLLDHCDQILIYVSKNVNPSFCFNVLGVPSFAAIPEEMCGLPELSNPESERLRAFVATLQDEKPYFATLRVIRDDGHLRTEFTERLIEDRFENALSYYEFLQHVKTQVK